MSLSRMTFAAVVVVAGVAGCATLAPAPLASYASLTMRPAAPQPGALRVRFMGTTTIALDDGDTAIMVDGFFSRPSLTRIVFGKIAPDPQRISEALDRAGIAKLAVVMTAHSHHDHAMDAPEVAKRTGALLLGSASTANIGRGAGLPEARIRVIQGGETLTFGRFTVTPIRSPHSPNAFFPGEVEAPLVPPARASDYKEGGNYSYLVQHGSRSALIHASANFVPGRFAHVRADVVFLGIATLGRQDEQFARDYWREVVRTSGARLVVPIHWDDFTRPLDEPLRPLPLWLDDFDVAIERVLTMAKADSVDVRFLPLYEPVDVFAADR